MNPLLPMSRREAQDHAGPKMRAKRKLRQDAGCWALALLVGCVGLLATAPVAAAVGTGKISGMVKHGGIAVPGIQVEAFNAATHEPVGFASTEVSGKYTVEHLAPGSYKVEFIDGSRTYAPRFYEEKFSFSEATEVHVEEGIEKSGINAELHEGGRISGTVTDTGGKQLPNVRITVNNQEGEFVEGTSTDSVGNFTVIGLAKGSYKVGFFPEEGLNFVPQYFEGRSFLSEATPIPVVEEATHSAINAKLEEGGKIAGTVTDAATHKPLSHVFVTAFESGTETFGFAVTNGSGEYTIVGLRNGSYTVEFEQFTETEAPSEYLTQTDKGIGVTKGSTTSGISAALIPKKPNNTGAPVASGTPSIGQTLSCANGSWIGMPTISYAYKWLRDGSAIAGATGSTYVVQAADQAHGLACEVTASNPAGHASATSNTLKVAAPPSPPPPPPTLTGAGLTNKRFRVAKKDTAIVAKAPRGTSFHLTLSEPSKLQIVITRSAPGLRRGHRCLAPTPKLKKAHARHCTRTLTAGILTRLREPQGADVVPFSGRIGHRPLEPGAYKAVLKASNANGLAAPVTLTFVVVR